MSAFRILIFALVLPFTATAEAVALKEGLGQGLLLRHHGNCYVVFPSHVHKDGPVFNLFTSSPQAAGIGTVFFRRTEADFALALVRGSASERCAQPFSKLPRDTSRLLNGSRSAVLERVNPQGGLERLAMRIDRIAWAAETEGAASGLYQYIYASTDTAAGETREVYQGTSGAILYIDDTPVGMVVTAPDATSVRALRMEEVTLPLARWFASGSFGALKESVSEEGAVDGLPFTITEWTGKLADEALPPTGLATGTVPFRAHPVSGSVSFVMELSDNGTVGVRELVLSGAVDESTATTPRKIVIDVDRSRKGPADFRLFSSVEMTPGAPVSIAMNTLVRRVRVRILSAWTADKPIEISSVSVTEAK
ncbi:hypothetical protein J3R80_14460 [Aliiroseovarius sp. Z3]|uniref:hypothetical protein n=1 Tax=Aliiroseovarius sp. Z3 TaxID=2811402 RepID=UPI0023B2D837|nr:hypothetical protein [Aliiroseovarius sp. Z3]MDE9451675.1 hypothetical protein [Aliiroseovarius sp. Z3]